MRKELNIIAFSVLLVFAVSFFMFSSSNNMTGFAVYGVDENNILASNNQNNSQEITRDIALNKISLIEQVLDEMLRNNFSIGYVNDSLIEAKRVLQKVDYAEILNNPNSSYLERAKASEALKLVRLENISYAEINNIYEDVVKRRDKAFMIYDSLTVAKFNIDKYRAKGVDLTEIDYTFNKTSEAFYNDRYSEAEEGIKTLRKEIDSKSSESSIVGDLKRGISGFLQRYWAYVILTLIILSLLFKFFYKRFSIYLLRNKIERMKADQKALVALMKKTQEERYMENKISGLTYNIRIKKYQDRINRIKEELPVLESRLRQDLKAGKASSSKE